MLTYEAIQGIYPAMSLLLYVTLAIKLIAAADLPMPIAAILWLCTIAAPIMWPFVAVAYYAATYDTDCDGEDK